MYVHLYFNSVDSALITVRNFDGYEVDIPTTGIDTLVIQNDGFYSLELLPFFRQQENFIRQFKHVIWFTPGEGHPKLIDLNLYRENGSMPVFETVNTFYNHFKPQRLEFYDNDLDTANSYRKWLRFNRLDEIPFEAKCWGGNKWASSLLFSLANYMNTDVETLLETTLPNIIKNRTKDSLYWCYNLKRRWGKVFIVYLLYKNNLLNDGIVTMHSPFINNRFKKLLAKYDYSIDDLEGFNKVLPLVLETKPSTLPKHYFTSPIDNILNCPIGIGSETYYFETNRFWSEKLIKPMLFGQVLLPMASYNVCHGMSENYGFKFSQSTYDIDKVKDPIDRAELVIDYLLKFKSDTKSLERELEQVYDNLTFNYKILYNQYHNHEWVFLRNIIQNGN